MIGMRRMAEFTRNLFGKMNEHLLGAWRESRKDLREIKFRIGRRLDRVVDQLKRIERHLDLAEL